MCRGPVPEGREGSADHPANARSILSLGTPFGSGWAPGGHPGTDAHPDAEWARFRAAAHFGQGMGWLAQERNSRVGSGPRAMVRLSMKRIQGWRLPALRYALRPKYSDRDMAGIRKR